MAGYYIDVKGFKELLVKLRVELSETALKQAIRKLAPRGCGAVSFFDFVKWFCSGGYTVGLKARKKATRSKKARKKTAAEAAMFPRAGLPLSARSAEPGHAAPGPCLDV